MSNSQDEIQRIQAQMAELQAQLARLQAGAIVGGNVQAGGNVALRDMTINNYRYNGPPPKDAAEARRL